MISNPWLKTAIVTALRALSVATGLVYIKFYTRLLSPEDIGIFFYLNALSYALNALVFLPFDFYMQARIARLPAVPGTGVRRIVLQALGGGLCVCALLSLPLVAFGKLTWLDLPGLYLLAALLYLCTTSRGVLNNRGGTLFVSAMLFFETVARLTALWLAVHVAHASARMLIHTSAAAYAVEFALIAWFSRRRLTFSDQPAVLDSNARVLASIGPISASAVCSLVQLQAFRVLYPLTHNAATSGAFSVVSNVGASAMAAVSSIYSQINLPRLYNTDGRATRSYIAVATVLTGVAMTIGFLASEPAVRLLTSAAYVPLAWGVCFGIFTEGVNLITGAASVYLMLRSAVSRLMYANLAAMAVSLAGTVAALFLWPASPWGIALPIAVSQIVFLFVLVLMSPRQSVSGSPA